MAYDESKFMTRKTNNELVAKFKIGDIVRIVDSEHRFASHAIPFIGSVGSVTSIQWTGEFYRFYIDVPNQNFGFLEVDIELVRLV